MWSTVRRWSRQGKSQIRLLYGIAVFYLVGAAVELAALPTGGSVSKWFMLGLGIWAVFMAIFFWLLARKRRDRLQRARDRQFIDDPELLMPPEIKTLVQQGQKIRAIKRYRELNPGIGLKEAKDIIDKL
jgi:type VI protein secretion system component VasK